MYYLWVALLFILGDTLLYTKAAYPERTRHWGYKLPGGGLVAYLRFGKDHA